MSLSLLFGIGVIAAALGPKLKRERDFDNKVDYEGLNKMSLADIEKRVGAKKNREGMYTTSSCKKLLKYAEEHASSSKEYDIFARRINVALNHQSRKRSEKRKNRFNSLPQESQERINNWIESKGGHEPSDRIEIITIRRGFTPRNQQQMIKDIMTKTWWGKCAVEKPVIKANPGENVELWKMHIPMIQVNICDKKSYQGDMRRLYKKCMKDCGHNPLY